MTETTNNAPVQGAKENTNKHKRFKNRPRKKVDNYVPNAPEEVLAVTIEQLELPEKTYEALKAGGVLTVCDIIKRRMTDMYKVKNIGKKDCFEIEKRLKKYNVTFREEEKAETTAPSQTPAKDKKEKQAPKDNNKDKNKKNDKKPASQKKEKEIVEEPVDKDALIKFYKKGKWGFKDYQGKVIIPPEYDEAFNFREDLACVEKDEKLGYIDKTGEIVIPLQYDSALSFSEDVASVTIGDYSGYIDKNGEIVFPLEYDVATSFMFGKANIKKDGRWGFLTKDGNIRWK